jgi:hypothetical protein
MRLPNEKRKFRESLYSKKILFLMFFLLLIGVKGTWNLYHKSEEAAVDSKRVAYELSELTKRQDFLNSELKRLRTISGQENEIRSKFNVMKQGEEVAVVVLANTDESLTQKGAVRGFFDHFFSSFVDIFR